MYFTNKLCKQRPFIEDVIDKHLLQHVVCVQPKNYANLTTKQLTRQIKLKHACTTRLIIQGGKLNLNMTYHKVNYEKTNPKHACFTIILILQGVKLKLNIHVL